MRTSFFLSGLAATLLAGQVAADLQVQTNHHHKRGPPDVYHINVQNLTPEDTVYDRTHKLFYQSNLWKGQVSVWNPHGRTHFNLKVPGVTSSGDGDQQCAGLSLDKRTDATRLYMVAKDAAAFRFGPDQSKTGPSSFHAFDLPAKKDQTPVWSVDLNSVQKALHKKYGWARPFGPVDSAQDAEGNSYVVFALGMPAIAKISKDGKKVEAWYAEKPNGSQRPGYTGVQYVSSANKIIAYGGPRALTAFDLNSSKPKGVEVKLNGDFGSLDGTEKLTMVPSTTDGSGPRLLGTKAPKVYSFRTTDDWKTASFRTFTRDEFKSNSLTVVTEAQFGGVRGIYGGGAYFGGPHDGRDDFPLYRIDDRLMA